MKRLAAIAATLALLFAVPVFAQTAAPESQSEPLDLLESPNATEPMPEDSIEEQAPGAGLPALDAEILAEESENEIRAEKLIGMPVVNAQDEKLGTVGDIVLSAEGQITGVVLSTGGFLGIAAKPVGVALSDISSAMESEILRLELSPEQIAQAPEFKTKEEKQREEETKLLEQQQLQQQQQAPTLPEPKTQPSE